MRWSRYPKLECPRFRRLKANPLNGPEPRAFCGPLVEQFSVPSKTRHQKSLLEMGGRNGASIAKFRTRRQSHICEMPRYRAVLSGFHILRGFEPLHIRIELP